MTDTETIRLTADVVATTPDGRVLLIRRRWAPHQGSWALPGGHLDPGEDSRTAAARELREETSVAVAPDGLRQIGAFDTPGRDERGRYVTIAYAVTVPTGTAVHAEDDATDARWWPLNDLPTQLAFDHADILARATAPSHHSGHPVRISIEGAAPALAEELVALAARHHAELSISTVHPGWTVDRAERYLRDLTAGSCRMAELVVGADGYLGADHLRREIGRLNGASNGLNRAVKRGVRKGWWPEGTPVPITPVSNPDNPSWHENIAYRMDQELVPVFREAFTRKAAGKKAAEDLGLSPGGTGKTSTGGSVFAATGYRPIDLDGGALPADDEDEKEARP